MKATEKMRRTKLRDLRPGAIVRVHSDWGVLVGETSVPLHRVVDFWLSGKESVPADLTVYVLEKRGESK